MLKNGRCFSFKLTNGKYRSYLQKKHKPHRKHSNLDGRGLNCTYMVYLRSVNEDIFSQ